MSLAPILLFPGSKRKAAPALILVADASNFGGRITDAQVEAMIAAGVAGVIVRVATADPGRIAIMQGQLAVLRSHGVLVGGYVFPDYEQRPADFLATLFSLTGELRSLWVDLEGNVLPDFLTFKSWMEAARATGLVPHLGIYSASYIVARIADWDDMSVFPLWVADYGNKRTLDVNFGGWRRAAGIQYAADTMIAGVPCDLSLFDPTALG